MQKYLRISKKSSTFAPVLDIAGSSSARLECLLWEQEVVSSNLAYPTKWSHAKWLRFLLNCKLFNRALQGCIHRY